VDVLIYDDAVRVEQADRLLVSYPCVYATGRRRITSIDARGRQHYHQLQMLQLALWTLDLIRVVWRMPPYQRRRWPRQGSFVRQISLFEPCAHEPVQIRGVNERTLQSTPMFGFVSTPLADGSCT
jgi:hypothetical protein